MKNFSLIIAGFPQDINGDECDDDFSPHCLFVKINIQFNQQPGRVANYKRNASRAAKKDCKLGKRIFVRCWEKSRVKEGGKRDF